MDDLLCASWQIIWPSTQTNAIVPSVKLQAKWYTAPAGGNDKLPDSSAEKGLSAGSAKAAASRILSDAGVPNNPMFVYVLSVTPAPAPAPSAPTARARARARERGREACMVVLVNSGTANADLAEKLRQELHKDEHAMIKRLDVVIFGAQACDSLDQ